MCTQLPFCLHRAHLYVPASRSARVARLVSILSVDLATTYSCPSHSRYGYHHEDHCMRVSCEVAFAQPCYPGSCFPVLVVVHPPLIFHVTHCFAFGVDTCIYSPLANVKKYIILRMLLDRTTKCVRHASKAWFIICEDRRAPTGRGRRSVFPSSPSRGGRIIALSEHDLDELLSCCTMFSAVRHASRSASALRAVRMPAQARVVRPAQWARTLVSACNVSAVSR